MFRNKDSNESGRNERSFISQPRKWISATALCLRPRETIFLVKSCTNANEAHEVKPESYFARWSSNLIASAVKVSDAFAAELNGKINRSQT